MAQANDLQEFTVAVTRNDGYRVVRVEGDVDLYTAPILERRLGELVDDGAREIVVDVAGVAFMDSTGVRALIRTLGRLRDHDGWMVVRSTTPSVQRVLHLTEADAPLDLPRQTVLE